MNRPSKRKQVEALGWNLVAVPTHHPAGRFRPDGGPGPLTVAYDDYKRPEAWIVNPPPGRSLAPRRFEGSSPNAAVRWAFDQAHAVPLSIVGSGVAGLLALATAAAASGVVVEDGAAPVRAPARPDAELLALCSEIAGCDRIAEAERNSDSYPWGPGKGEFRASMDRLSEALDTKKRLVALVVEMTATTPAGVLAQAAAVAGLFKTMAGMKAGAVRALLASLEAVLQPVTGAPR